MIRDGLLHIPMGLLYALPCALFSWPLWFGMAALCVIYREAEQHAAKHYSFAWPMGLKFWEWSSNKLFKDTLVAVVPLVAAAVATGIWGY